MRKQIFSNLDDLDLSKVAEVVNKLWEEREQLAQTIEYVTTYQESITNAITYINDNKEHLGELIERLPELLDKTGVGIETAGLSAERASTLLTGDSKDDEVISAYEMTGMAAIALERCNVQLEQVALLIQQLGEQLDGVRIPSIKPQFTEVMGFNVLSGIDLEENALSHNVAERFHSSADRISEISTDFSNVSEQFRKLGTMLVHTGDNLHSVGAQLQQSGRSLRVMTPDSATRAITIDLEPVEQPIPTAKSVEKEIAKLQAEAEKVRAARATTPEAKTKKPAKPAKTTSNKAKK